MVCPPYHIAVLGCQAWMSKPLMQPRLCIRVLVACCSGQAYNQLHTSKQTGSGLPATQEQLVVAYAVEMHLWQCRLAHSRCSAAEPFHQGSSCCHCPGSPHSPSYSLPQLNPCHAACVSSAWLLVGLFGGHDWNRNRHDLAVPHWQAHLQGQVTWVSYTTLCDRSAILHQGL